MSDFRQVSRAAGPDPSVAPLRDLLAEMRRNTAETQRSNELLAENNKLLVEVKELLGRPDPIPVVPYRGPS